MHQRRGPQAQLEVIGIRLHQDRRRQRVNRECDPLESPSNERGWVIEA